MNPTHTSGDEGKSQYAHRWLTSYGPIVVVAAAFISFAARLFELISQYAVNVFFSDQWAFNDATLFQQHSLWRMFTWQNGPHRQGLGALFAKLVEPTFHWNSRTESFVVGSIIVVAALCALYLKKRLYGEFSIFDLLIPAIIFIPAQYESLFVTANFAHGPFPLLLMMIYCVGWTCGNDAVKYALILITNFFMIYTGFGLLLGLLTPFLLVIEYRASNPGERPPMPYLLVIVLVSIFSLGSFFLGYKFDSALDCFSPFTAQPKYYVAYMAFMWANLFAVRGVGTPQLIVGLVTLTALFGALITSLWQLLRTHLPNPQRNRRIVAAVMISYCLLFCMSTAYGRLCGGLWTAKASRYVMYLEVGVLGLYFQLLNIRGNAARRSFLAGLLVVVLAASTYIDRAEIGYFPNIKLQWKRCYFMNEDPNLCNQMVGFPIYTHDPEGTHLQEKLEYLRATRQNLYTDAK